MARVLLILFALLVTVFAVSKCLFTKKENQPYNLPKPLWVMLIILALPLGGITYLVVLWVKRAEANSPTGEIEKPKNLSDLWRMGRAPEKQEGQGLPSAPQSPDDDPDYLFSIDAKIARREYDGLWNETEKTGDSEPGNLKEPAPQGQESEPEGNEKPESDPDSDENARDKE